MAENSEWVYRVEGNNNVVFSNTKSNQVLRIRKLARRNQHASVPTRGEDFVAIEMDYLVNVVYRLLDGLNVHYKAERLSVSKKLLDELSAVISHNRPAEFCDYNNNIDESARHALLMPNFCRSCVPQSQLPVDHKLISIDNNPVISVELRPKSSYIPTALKGENGLHGRHMCLSCINKLNQRHQPNSATQSMYCPLDLFSRDSTRIKRALQDMIACPQRHLSVRRNDNILFSQTLATSENVGCKDLFEHNVSSMFGRNGTQAFLNLVSSSLLHKITETQLCKSSTRTSAHCRRGKDHFSQQNGSSSEIKMQCGSNILDFLSAVKDMCDIPVAEVQRMYDEIQAHVSSNKEDAEVLSLNLPYDAVIWRRAATLPCDNDPVLMDNQASTSKLRQLEDYANLLRRYIIARAFSCCSLIISFSKLRKVDNFTPHRGVFCVSDGFGVQYVCSIAILDLYKEPLNQIDKYCAKAKEFTSVFNGDAETLGN